MATKEEMIKEVQDAKDRVKATAAFDAADKTEPAPAPEKKDPRDAVRGQRSYAKGGSVDKSQDKAMITKAFKQHDAQEHKGGAGTTLKLAAGGSASGRADGCAIRGKTRA